MPVLTSHVDTSSETYQGNREAQLALLAQLDEQVTLAVAGGGERYRQRHRERGRLLVRERIELLLDPASPFLELSTLAAWEPSSPSGPAWSRASEWCRGWSAF